MEWMFEWAWKGTLVLVAGAGWVRMLKTQSAGQRHVIWIAAWVALFALPLLALLPKVDMPLLPAQPATPMVMPAETGLEGSALSPTTGPSWEASTGLSAWLGLWAFGLMLLSVHQLGGYFGLHLMTRKSEEVQDHDWLELTKKTCERFGLQQRISLRRSTRIAAPAVWGWRNPTILLPYDCLTWDRERIEVVLLHELAHLSRRDWITQSFARTVALFHWFNPVAWWALSRTRLEAEKACDDLVLHRYPTASKYAAFLVMFAREVATSIRRPGYALTMARPVELVQRVEALLARNGNRREGSRRAGLVACGMTLALVSTLSMVRLTHAAPPSAPAEKKVERKSIKRQVQKKKSRSTTPKKEVASQETKSAQQQQKSVRKTTIKEVVTRQKKKKETNRLEVYLRNSTAVFVNGKSIKFEDLGKIIRKTKVNSVRIAAEKVVPYERVISVFNAVRDEGLKDVSLAVPKRTPEGIVHKPHPLKL